MIPSTGIIWTPVRALLATFLVGVGCVAFVAQSSEATQRSSSSASLVHASTKRYKVMLTPPVQGGMVGWCVDSEIENEDGASCPLSSEPGRLVMGDWIWSGDGAGLHQLILVRRQVAAVSVDGSAPIRTRAEPGLSYGFRAALAEINAPFRLPTGLSSGVTPFAASGKPLAEPQRRPPTIASGLARRFWQRPSPELYGACRIEVHSLPGLRAQWGNVVPYLHAVSDRFERPLMSCVDTEFFFRKWPLDAGVDLDTAHPGAAPPPLPGFRRLRRHPNLFQAPAWTELVARRLPRAWLLVEGGKDLRQRLTVLQHLNVKVHI